MSLTPFNTAFLNPSTSKTTLGEFYNGNVDTAGYDPNYPEYPRAAADTPQGQEHHEDTGEGGQEDTWKPAAINPDQVDTLKMNHLDAMATTNGYSATEQLAFWRKAAKVIINTSINVSWRPAC